jgi:hypothetical protein
MAPKPPPFDPDRAPVVKLTPEERSAISKDMNKVALKLHDAGIQLYGFYKIHHLVPFWGPLGFDFMCDNWKQLIDAADRASKLGFDLIDMPGSDPWRRAGVLNVGWTQIGKPPLVHLDVAIDLPGRCRLYILEDSDERQIDALRRARKVNARSSPVFSTIFRRMEGLGIDLDDYIGSHLEAGRNVLDGINFRARDHNLLLQALTDLKYPAGEKVFFSGARSARGHFAGNLSFLATDGIGFRQIWQTFPAERPIATTNPQAGNPRTGPAMDPRGSGRFGDSPNLPDLSSVHIAVSKWMCNVHIDQMGFVVTDANGTVIVDPDALRHIFVELLWKTDLQGKMPFWALDHVNFIIPSSPNDFSRVGVSIDVAQFGRVNIALNGTCSVDAAMETAGTLTLRFTF